MEKKFFKYVLLGVFALSLSVTFVGCKDYDDDIKDLQEQLNKKASIDELTSKVAALQTSVDAARSEATTAKTEAAAAVTKAEAALKAAQEGGGGVDEAALANAVKDAKDALQAQIDKLASLDAVDTKIAALEEKLKSDFITSEDISALSGEVEALAAEVMALVGHRLTSLSVIATTHINGIAAIKLVTLKYIPQVKIALTSHTPIDKAVHATHPVLDHKDGTGSAKYISLTDKNLAYFHVSPSLGVTDSDIELPSFECIESENITRAGVTIKNNTPIEPVSYGIDKNVLTVKFKKTVSDPIGTKGDAHGAGKKENFWMASLKAPIAAKNYTEAEKAAYDEDGTKVYVNSEYVRIEEFTQAPYLVNSKTNFSLPIVGDFADETQTTTADGTFYVHYHDSVCVYESEAKELIAEKLLYNKEFDLKTLVKVCVTDIDDFKTSHANHEDFVDYADYGLAFRFYLATKPYITLGGPEGNTNKTDQQQFAKIDSPENGMISSKVYTVGETSATAVGREPIVRIELIDTNNGNALIAVRYLKIKWVEEKVDVTPRELEFSYPDSIYYCANYRGLIGTVAMNEIIYHGAQDGGMTKEDFHRIYTVFDGTTGAGQGTVKDIRNTEAGVDSYNILWTLTHTDIVTKYPVWASQETMDFSKVCYYKDPNGVYPTLEITLKRTIYKPVFSLWGYDGRYWKNNNQWDIFNVNPIVYDTEEFNPAWNVNGDNKNNPTCNIYTDLLNGFLDDKGVKPVTGAGGAIWYKDTEGKNEPKTREGKKYYYSAFYPTTGGTNLGVKAGTYADDGVRFIFDAEKLATGAYVYDFFDGTTTVKKNATINSDGTILYVGGTTDAHIAARIINNIDNLRPDRTELTYNIRLEEADPDALPYMGANPTEAAKAIVGKNVPIKLVADLCDDAHLAAAHTVNIKDYDAFIIDPLHVKEGTTENFTDATVGGSTINVKGAFTYLSWNADEKGNYYPVSNASDASALAKALWNFYEVVPGEWMTGQIKSNLKLVSGNLIPTEGVMDGPLPSNTSVVYDAGKEELTYNNYSGTPVNWDYKLYIPVKFGYKWKTFTKTFVVDVKKNAGTPAETPVQ